MELWLLYNIEVDYKSLGFHFIYKSEMRFLIQNVLTEENCVIFINTCVYNFNPGRQEYTYMIIPDFFFNIHIHINIKYI